MPQEHDRCARGLAVPCLLLPALVVDACRARPAPGAGSLWIDSRAMSKTLRSVVPGATVVVTNKSTNRPGRRDRRGGAFHVRRPARRRLQFKASQQGFKTFEQTEVTVTINSVSRVDVTLEVGSMGDTVTVNAEPPKLQTETAEVHEPAGRGTHEPPGAARPQLSAGVPDAARLRAPYQLALHPHQSVAVAGIHGQRDERRPEQHAHRRRQHHAHPAAARRPPTSRRSSRSRRSTSSPTAWTRSRGSPAAPRSTCRRGADQRRPRIGVRVFHRPAPEGLADAVRRCRAEHR